MGCLEHPGFAGQKAHRWWAEQTTKLSEQFPTTADEALPRVDELRVPKKIRVQPEGKYWRVVKVLEWQSEAEQTAAAEEEAETAEFFAAKGLNL
ncbi:MAG: hypothetical protein C0501_27825 [Isosphaera sp.]|nr:hypothetical protein [Isosphaera sp.]